MQATARIYVQTRQSKRTAEDLCPVKLCVTYNRDRKYYSISDKVKNNDWNFISDIPDKKGQSEIDRVFANPPKGKYKDISFDYNRIVDIAEKIINDLPIFSFSLFEEKFFNKVADWDSVFSAMWFHIQELKNEERFGYASSFESTLRAIKEFHTGKTYEFNPRKDKVATREEVYLSGKPLRFVDITVTWLKKFEKWLKTSGRSTSTQGIYMRNIRVLFNLAISEHKVKAEYPFNKYKPKNATKRKKALTAQQINLIVSYKTEHPKMQFYRDIFIFSTLGNGLNLADIARLKYSNIDEDEICITREKTKNKPNETEIRISITATMWAIIKKHGNKAIGHDAYIFPVLKNDWDEVRNYAEIKQLTKQVNKYIRRVAVAVGIKEKISSYTARHSWTTISKNSGASTEFIKEQLGHSSVKVTEGYIDSLFGKSARKEHSEEIEKIIVKAV